MKKDFWVEVRNFDAELMKTLVSLNGMQLSLSCCNKPGINSIRGFIILVFLRTA